MLAEFEHTTTVHFLLHCAAVSLVVIGVIALVSGENALAPAAGGMHSSASKGGAAKTPTTPRATANSTLRARTAGGGQRERGAAAAARHVI